MRPLMETYAEYLFKLCAIRLSDEVKALYEYDAKNTIIRCIEDEIAHTAKLISEYYDGDN